MKALKYAALTVLVIVTHPVAVVVAIWRAARATWQERR